MKRIWLAVKSLVLVLASPMAVAGSFAVNPVRITLDARDLPVAALTVRNNTAIATVVQADALQWMVQGEGDQYLPSNELLVTPPVFTLQPHGVQVVRVGLRQRTPAADGSERSFRLYLTEVPPPPAPDFHGLNVALRLGVPVFVQAPGTAAKLGFELRAARPDLVELVAGNSGTAHARLNRIAIHDQGGSQVAELTLARDLLAGQRRRFSVPLAAPTRTPLQVRIDTSEGPLHFVLSPPPG